MAASLLKETPPLQAPPPLGAQLKIVVEKVIEEEIKRTTASIEKLIERRVRKRLGKIATKIEESMQFGRPEINISVTFGGEEKSDGS